MNEPRRVFDRTPNSDELALGYAWGEDENGELLQLKGVSQGDRNAHFYVIGATRTGKTKLLEEMIAQDIKNGEGFGIIDPHGDLIEAVKGRLAQNAEGLDERVILIDPTDGERSVCFNPLEATEGVEAAELASELVLVFKKIWADAWGARTEEIFRNTLIILIENNLTLAEFSLVLRDAAVRAKLTANIKNEICREFFQEQYPAWNEKTKTEWTAPILNKIGALLSDERVREIFLSPKSTFSLRKAMDEKKIVLVKLDKGRLKGAGELLGALLLSKMQMAAFGRTDTRESERKKFYLYIDEFHNFATESFKDTLAEAAKYKFSLILAHQNLSQLPTELRASILTNCGLQAYFRVARFDAELLAKEAFAGVYDAAPSWEEYFQTLQTLPNRVCVVKNKIEGGIVVIKIPDVLPAHEEAGMDEKEFEDVVKASRIGERYLRQRDDIQNEYRVRRDALTVSEEPENFRRKKR
jgi:type IV secretory pathway TraG/TraD family ATPase VirD4